MKKHRLLSLLLLFLLLCSCGQTETTVATVNGEKITDAETEYFSRRYRADILNEYAEKYHIDDFSDFWDREFDGVTPAQALRERAFAEAVTAKIKLLLMREYGIYEDISYDALLRKAERYNAENENAVGVVGLRTIDLDSFYTYYIFVGETALKSLISSEEYETLIGERLASAVIEEA